MWLANPGGSGKYQVTLDGTTNDPYTSVSQANDGTIEAVKGTGDGARIYRMKQNGALLNTPFATAVPGGPLDSVVSPNGSVVSFWGIIGTNVCYPYFCFGTSRTYQLSYADHYVDPSTFNPNYSGWTSYGMPAWLSNSRQLIFPNNGNVWYYDLHASDPVQWMDWSKIFDTTTFGFGSWIEGGASADGTRLALVAGEDNQARYSIQVFAAGGDLATGNPPNQPTPYCDISPPDGTNGTNSSYPGSYVYFDSLSWSPDHQSLAYEYKGAIYVANIGNLAPGFDCATQVTVTKVIDPGSDPYWGPANVNPGPRQPCSGQTGAKLKRCQAKQRYTSALAACSHKKSKSKRKACRKKATVKYHRKLALIKCESTKKKSKHATCVQNAQKIKK